MKLIIPTIVPTLIATAGFADQSDRYNDLRLDTSLNGTIHAEGAGAARPTGRPADLWLETFAEGSHPKANLSTRSALSRAGEGFAYGGYGQHNDSR